MSSTDTPSTAANERHTQLVAIPRIDPIIDGNNDLCNYRITF